MAHRRPIALMPTPYPIGDAHDVSPNLIPLLRKPTAAEIPPDDTPEVGRARDDLGSARGLAVGFLLAVPLWGLIALAIWWAVG